MRRREPGAWAKAAEIAGAALAGYVYAPVGTATYYHTTAVNPWWAAKVTRVAAIGAHLFYRLPGSWGGLSAFTQRYAGVEPTLTAGRHIAPKSVEEIIQTIEGSVTVHRGSYAATEAADATSVATDTVASTPAPSIVAGVRIHRGTPRGKPEDHGVTVHRGAALPETASR